jgi:hypothetical protein
MCLVKCLKWHPQIEQIDDMVDKTFKNNKNAKKHMKTILEDKELFDCEYCHKQFKDKYNLKHHTQNSCLVKFGRSNLICSICQKGFSTKPALAAHKKIHEASINIEKGDQSAQCNVCLKTIARA